MAKQLLLICAVAALVTGTAAAQAMVGYGALTGASATPPHAAGKAAAKNLGRLGRIADQPAPLPASPRMSGAMDLANRASDAPSIVLKARWGQAVEPPADMPQRVPGDDLAKATAPAPGAALNAEPSSLQRGGDIADVIAELGKPALVINGSGSVGYDRKYVFRSDDDTRYSVLVLGSRIVDWSDR